MDYPCDHQLDFAKSGPHPFGPVQGSHSFARTDIGGVSAAGWSDRLSYSQRWRLRHTVPVIVPIGLILVNVGVGYMLRRAGDTEHMEDVDTNCDSTLG